MSSRLKNIGETYQRMIQLRKYKFKLNLAKYTSSIKSCELLGFMWNEDCHEVFEKIKPQMLRKSPIKYLIVFDESMSWKLGQHNKSVRKRNMKFINGTRNLYMMKQEIPYNNGHLSDEDIMILFNEHGSSNEGKWTLLFCGASNVTFYRIPCEDNKLDDALAMLSSMFKIILTKDMSFITMQSCDYLV
ncbi:hypothetical protein CR513_06248, partial [Mucuna pruriens]